jgi:bifunctional DNA-binding transcriptional regulator/antitoxin component of YhaV-PrlF toxin-antitoxin module
LTKEVRDALGISSGGKLAVIVRGDEIVLRKVEGLSIPEISSKISSTVEKEDLNIDALIEEAVERARKQR